MSDWLLRHQAAMTNPRSDFEKAFVTLFQGWLMYAEAYDAKYHSRLADDAILGAAWNDIAEALRTLLNGDIGRLDTGVMDNAISHIQSTR